MGDKYPFEDFGSSVDNPLLVFAPKTNPRVTEPVCTTFAANLLAICDQMKEMERCKVEMQNQREGKCEFMYACIINHTDWRGEFVHWGRHEL